MSFTRPCEHCGHIQEDKPKTAVSPGEWYRAGTQVLSYWHGSILVLTEAIWTGDNWLVGASNAALMAKSKEMYVLLLEAMKILAADDDEYGEAVEMSRKIGIAIAAMECEVQQ